MDTAISRKTPAALPEVGTYAVKLPPADCHFIAVGRVDCYGRLISGIADDIVPIRINIYLVADEDAIRRNHSWRSLQTVNVRRRHIVFFQWLG